MASNYNLSIKRLSKLNSKPSISQTTSQCQILCFLFTNFHLEASLLVYLISLLRTKRFLCFLQTHSSISFLMSSSITSSAPFSIFYICTLALKVFGYQRDGGSFDNSLMSHLSIETGDALWKKIEVLC